jgi:hypothetical protein
MLAEILILKIYQGAMIVCVPMFILLFLRNLRACLICYALSLLLCVLVSHNLIFEIEYLFIRPRAIFFYALIFMSVYSYRARLFPLSSVILSTGQKMSN